MSTQKNTPEKPTRSLPPIPTTPERDDEVKQLVARFEIGWRNTFETFFHDDVQLPLWEPQEGPDSSQSHISGLKIPDISGLPSLLLHNLGQPSHNPKLAERIAHLFKPIHR
jgi:hypothetical protein